LSAVVVAPQPIACILDQRPNFSYPRVKSAVQPVQIEKNASRRIDKDVALQDCQPLEWSCARRWGRIVESFFHPPCRQRSAERRSSKVMGMPCDWIADDLPVDTRVAAKIALAGPFFKIEETRKELERERRFGGHREIGSGSFSIT
jgi:hypothetical protein